MQLQIISEEIHEFIKSGSVTLPNVGIQRVSIGNLSTHLFSLLHHITFGHYRNRHWFLPKSFYKHVSPMQHWCTESANVIKNALKFGSFALEKALKRFFPSTLYLYYTGTASHLYEFSGSPQRFKGRVQRWWALQEQEKRQHAAPPLMCIWNWNKIMALWWSGQVNCHLCHYTILFYAYLYLGLSEFLTALNLQQASTL